MKYECAFCGKKYTRKRNYEEHHLFCKEVVRSKRIADIDEQNIKEAIPSTKEMYSIMKKVLLKYEKLEKEVLQLRNHIQKQEKVNIQDWLILHRNSPSLVDSNQFAKEIQFTEEDLHISLKDGYAISIIEHIKLYSVEENVNIPFISFPQKQNQLYMYCKSSDSASSSGTWKLCNSYKDIQHIIEIFHNKLLALLLRWKEKHEEKGKKRFPLFSTSYSRRYEKYSRT